MIYLCENNHELLLFIVCLPKDHQTCIAFAEDMINEYVLGRLLAHECSDVTGARLADWDTQKVHTHFKSPSNLYNLNNPHNPNFLNNPDTPLITLLSPPNLNNPS